MFAQAFALSHLCKTVKKRERIVSLVKIDIKREKGKKKLVLFEMEMTCVEKIT